MAITGVFRKIVPFISNTGAKSRKYFSKIGDIVSFSSNKTRAEKVLEVASRRISGVEDSEIKNLLEAFRNYGTRMPRNSGLYISRNAGKLARNYTQCSPQMREIIASKLKGIDVNNIKLSDLKRLKEVKLLSEVELTSRGLYESGGSEIQKVIRKYGKDLKDAYPENYKNEVRFRDLRTYLGKYCKKDPELANKLYENYYLANINPETAQILRKIDKDFRVKVFLMDVPEAAPAEYIYRELAEYMRASGGKANLGRFIDVSNLYNYKEFFKGNAAAFASWCDDTIVINGCSNIDYALRHELMHLNQTGRYNIFNDIQILLSKLKPGKKFWWENFCNAGISKSHIHYAYTNPQEFTAVAAEGDVTKYSKIFKIYLWLMGMPKWAFNLDKTLAASSNVCGSVANLSKKELVSIMKNKNPLNTSIKEAIEKALAGQNIKTVPLNLKA